MKAHELFKDIKLRMDQLDNAIAGALHDVDAAKDNLMVARHDLKELYDKLSQLETIGTREIRL